MHIMYRTISRYYWSLENINVCFSRQVTQTNKPQVKFLTDFAKGQTTFYYRCTFVHDLTLHPITHQNLTIFVFIIFKHWQGRCEGEGKEGKERKKANKNISMFMKLINFIYCSSKRKIRLQMFWPLPWTVYRRSTITAVFYNRLFFRRDVHIGQGWSILQPFRQRHFAPKR